MRDRHHDSGGPHPASAMKRRGRACLRARPGRPRRQLRNHIRALRAGMLKLWLAWVMRVTLPVSTSR